MPNKLHNPDASGGMDFYQEYSYKAEQICKRFGFAKESAAVLLVTTTLYQIYRTQTIGSWQDRNRRMANAVAKLLNVSVAHTNFFIGVLGQPYEKKNK